jgi:hypothetical protein
MDERYTYNSNRNQVSRWLRDRIVVPNHFEQFDLKLRAFFQSMASKKFVPKVKQLEQLKIAFDDINANEKNVLPQEVNSKLKFGNQGPSNNYRERKGRIGGTGAKFTHLGLIPNSDSEEETKAGLECE